MNVSGIQVNLRRLWTGNTVESGIRSLDHQRRLGKPRYYLFLSIFLPHTRIYHRHERIWTCNQPDDQDERVVKPKNFKSCFTVFVGFNAGLKHMYTVKYRGVPTYAALTITIDQTNRCTKSSFLWSRDIRKKYKIYHIYEHKWPKKKEKRSRGHGRGANKRRGM